MPCWVQRNTFELLWRLRVEDARDDGRDDGWLRTSLVVGQVNFSLTLGRALKDLVKTAGAADLLEWDRGNARVRLCVAPERISHDPALMQHLHRDLLKLLG